MSAEVRTAGHKEETQKTHCNIAAVGKDKLNYILLDLREI